jgi:hypothetical protein
LVGDIIPDSRATSPGISTCVAKASHTGPCSLLRTTGPKDEAILNGHYIILQPLLAGLLRGKRKDVTIEVLASVTDEQLQ